MAEFLSRCTIKIGTTEYPLSFSNLKIRTVPRLDGAPSFITDISGKRRTNYRTCEFYLDGEFSFPEHGYQWDEWTAFASAILAHTISSTDRIDLSLDVPYSASSEITDIIIIIDEDLLNHNFEDSIRLRPSSLKFKEVNPRTSHPAWYTS